MSNTRTRVLITLLLLGFLCAGLGVGAWPSRASTYAMIPLVGGKEIKESTVAVADFNGDGDKEIVAGGTDGKLYVLAYNGSNWSVAWSRQVSLDVNAASPPNPTADNDIRSSPAVADLDNDGDLEIVVAVGGDIHSPTLSDHKNGGILVYSYVNTWSFALDGNWPQPKIDECGWPPPGYSYQDGYWDGIVSTPALGDLDGDGDLEIVFLGIDRRIHAYHHTGAVVSGWPIYRYNGDALLRGGMSSPALGDIDGDGLPEVIVGTMSPEWEGDGGPAPDYTKGTLWAINGDSTNVPGFPVATEQYVFSSPALGDIDDDGWLEIVVSVGWGTSGRENIVYAFNHDGTLMPNWPRETAGVTSAPPALGDIDGDGALEIVVGCGNTYDPSSCSKLYAWNPDGSKVFESTPTTQIPGYNAMPYSPVLADFDNDGTVEILIVHLGDWAVTVVEPNGSSNSSNHAAGGGLMASPVVDDLDGDGKLEIVVGGIDYNGGNPRGGVHIWDENGTTESAQPWPMFHQNVARTGVTPDPPRLGFPNTLRVFHQHGSGETQEWLTGVWNEGEDSFDWSIGHEITRLQTIPASGTVTDNTPVQLVISTTGVTTGWHTLGTMAVTGTVEGEHVENSPHNATLYLYVGDVSCIYLPLIFRNH